MASEGWGQGNARVSALGVAGMMATLAATANGDAPRAPHLVDSVRSMTTTWTTRDAAGTGGDQRLTHDVAEVILSGLSYSHRAGTARLACEQVFPAKTCKDMDWIAGQDGDADLSQRRRHARRARAPVRAGRRADPQPVRRMRRAASLQVVCRRLSRRLRSIRAGPRRSRCSRSATGSPPADAFTAPSDHGPNPAAEIAMQIAGRSAGYLKGPAP